MRIHSFLVLIPMLRPVPYASLSNQFMVQEQLVAKNRIQCAQCFSFGKILHSLLASYNWYLKREFHGS